MTFSDRLHILCSIPKTLRFNFHYFPFKTAIKCPVMVSRRVYLRELYSYLLFVLLYFPCIATIIAIKNETGSWRWACFAAVYTTIIAWIVSAAVYQIGSIF